MATMVRPGVQSARDRGVGPAGLAYWLSAASLLAFTIAAVLRGTAVMNGSARGTALVVLIALISVVLLLRGLSGTPAQPRVQREGEFGE